MLDPQRLHLGELSGAVDTQLSEWSASDVVSRVWGLDHTVWSEDPVPELADRLGWLGLSATMRPALSRLAVLAESIREAGFTRVVLCGMGGSSLAPEVFYRTFGAAPDHPDLTVVDSTHPDEVARVIENLDPLATIFIISSKSGGTIETLSLFRTFWSQVAAHTDTPGDHFMAITDAGSSLEELATARHFRDIFTTPADVGGRYSAFTFFGLVPAALIGVNIGRLLDRADIMANACSPETPVEANPGAVLGAVMGQAAKHGHDKATFLVAPSLAAFPVWVEQLIAESTGKDGVGIVPVADEPIGDPSEYARDRLIIHIAAKAEPDPFERLVDQLEEDGVPIVKITVDGPYDLGQEMYRAEFATAMAGAVLAINPFDQPNVQEAKELARRAMDGELDAEEIHAVDPEEESAIDEWLSGVATGDYVGVQAYLPYGVDDQLEAIRAAIRSVTNSATTSGYGPRFLHSTGQLHKGGANNGLFLQIVDEPQAEVPVPETDYTFNQLIRAQADGDFQALVAEGRRVLRVNVGSQTTSGLATLVQTFEGL